MSLPPSSLISFLKELIPFKDAGFKLYQWFGLRFFKFTYKKPLPELKAEAIAFSVLSGRIEKADSFHDYKDKNSYVVAVRKTSDKDYDSKVFLLKRLGQTFHVIWTSSDLHSLNNFEIVDLDHDGNHEITFSDWSGGSGASSTQHFHYSPKLEKLSIITESMAWMNVLQPGLQVEVSPTSDNAIIDSYGKYLASKGYLKTSEVNPLAPENADRYWLITNGALIDGPINIRYYDGYPKLKGNAETLMSSEFEWLACFKGPLYGYSVRENKFFVVYSPANIYDWPYSVVYFNKVLYFLCRQFDDRFISFRFGDQDGALKQHLFPKDLRLPFGAKLTIKDSLLTLVDHTNNKICDLPT